MNIYSTYNRYAKYREYIYPKANEMATLLLKVEWGGHHAFSTKEGDGSPAMERRICISFNLKRKVEIYYEHKLYMQYV